MLESSEFQLAMNLCEQKRTQILTILMLSMENLRLAGYMLTRNRSMFLSTDGRTRLALLLPFDAFSTTRDEPML